MALRALLFLTSAAIGLFVSVSAFGSIVLDHGYRYQETYAFNSNPYGYFGNTDDEVVNSPGSYLWGSDWFAGDAGTEQSRALSEAGFDLQTNYLSATSNAFGRHRSDFGQSTGYGYAHSYAYSQFTATSDYLFDLYVYWFNIANYGLGYVRGYTDVSIYDATDNNMVHYDYFTALANPEVVNEGSYHLYDLSLQAGHDYRVMSRSYSEAVQEQSGVNYTRAQHYGYIAMSNLRAIPEPGSLLVWGVLGFAVGMVRRRKVAEQETACC